MVAEMLVSVALASLAAAGGVARNTSNKFATQLCRLLAGEEPLMKVRLTRCRDGGILAITLSHIITGGTGEERSSCGVVGCLKFLACFRATTPEKQVHG